MIYFSRKGGPPGAGGFLSAAACCCLAVLLRRRREPVWFMEKLRLKIVKLAVLFAVCVCMASLYVHASVVVNVSLMTEEHRVIKYKAGQRIQLLRFNRHIRQASYKSSNSSVATVSKTGQIKIKKPGKAVITVNARGKTAKYKLKATSTNTMYDYANKFGRGLRYFIFLNRAERTVYVLRRNFGEYRLFRTLPCCVGAPSTPTPAGNWSIRGKGDYFVTGASNRCWYFSQFLGSYMFHSQIYDGSSSPSNLVDGSMGVACSHGCVRLYLDDAKWLQDTVPYGTRVYII